MITPNPSFRRQSDRINMAAVLLIRSRRRQNSSVPRYLRFRGNPLDLPDGQFISKYRLCPSSFVDLCQILKPRLQRSTRGYSVELQVLSALRLFGTGSFQSVIGDNFLIQASQSTVSRNLVGVVNALIEIMPQFVKFPLSEEARFEKKRDFFRNGFPNVVGAIDGTLINIHDDWFVFISRKGKFALNVQLVCDARMEILDVVARWPGSTHDSFIWKRSKLRELFVSGQIPRQNFLLGDSGYPLEPWLLTQYSSPTTDAQRIFNRKHKTLRAVVEHCNGLLKSRFRCLHESGGVLLYTSAKYCQIILACTVLHNICIQRNIPWDNYELEESMQPNNNVWLYNDNLRREALLIRDEIAANISRR